MVQGRCAPLAGSIEPSVQRHMEESPENSAVQLSTPAQLRLHLRNPWMDRSALISSTLIKKPQPFAEVRDTRDHTVVLHLPKHLLECLSLMTEVLVSPSLHITSSVKRSAEHLCQLPVNWRRYGQHRLYKRTCNKEENLFIAKNTLVHSV